MRIALIQVQMIVFDAPGGQESSLASPLDDLVERFRNEMRYGRDAGCPPRSKTASDTAPFQDCRSED